MAGCGSDSSAWRLDGNDAVRNALYHLNPAGRAFREVCHLRNHGDYTVPLPERLQRIDGRVQRLRIERREERPGARDPLHGASLRGQVAGQGRNARWAWWQESRSRDPIPDRLGIPRQARGGLNATRVLL